MRERLLAAARPPSWWVRLGVPFVVSAMVSFMVGALALIVLPVMQAAALGALFGLGAGAAAAWGQESRRVRRLKRLDALRF